LFYASATLQCFITPRFEFLKYEIVTVILDDGLSEIPGLPDYQIKYSKKNKNIDIKKTIKIRKKSERGEYKEETAIVARPLEG
jgi:hypothetical protein